MRFANWHPVNGFLYFILVIGGTIMSMHPFLLFASFTGASLYTLYHKGIRDWLKKLRIVVPILLFFSLLNPLFNHQGVTVIAYYKDNPVTAESVVYGLMTAFLLSTVILWFGVFHEFMTSDKWTYLFGSVAPNISLVISMALRMVPCIVDRAKRIQNARKGLGVGKDSHCVQNQKGIMKLVKRFNSVKRDVYALTAWSLEDSVETAISMKNRGYGFGKRTTYTNDRMCVRDVRYCALLLGFGIPLLIGMLGDFMTALYFPEIRFPKWDASLTFFYLLFLILVNIPILFDIMEELKWKYLRSKI